MIRKLDITGGCTGLLCYHVVCKKSVPSIVNKKTSFIINRMSLDSFHIAGGPYLNSLIMKILILYNDVPICVSVIFILY